MKKKLSKISIYICGLLLIVCVIIASCDKKDFLPISSEVPTGNDSLIKDSENINDTLIITAKEYIFPGVKQVGQAVTYFINAKEINNACGGFTVEFLDQVNLDVYDHLDNRVMFEITGYPVWRLDYRIKCVNDTLIYSDGFIMGASVD